MPKTKQNPIEKHFSNFTRYHYYCFAILFTSKIPLYWHVVSIIFLSPPMQFECMSPGAWRTGNCPCENPQWNRSVFIETIQTKFDLRCEREWIISFSESMMYVGSLIGSLVFGFLSDKFGRLSVFSMCCFSIGISGCLVSVMPTATWYIIMRCIEGIGIGGAVVTGYVLVIEYCGVSYRETIAALYHLPLNIGHITLAGLSYLIRHVDFYQMALSVPVFIVAFSWWMLYESPKWLMDNDFIEEAATVMKDISKFNKSSSCDNIQTEMEEFKAVQTLPAHKKIRFWQIFRFKELTINLLCMSIIYLVCGMGYYGVSQYIGHMSGNIHLNVAISGLLLIPGTVAAIFLIRLLTRRIFLISTNLLSGLFMIAVITIPAEFKFTRMILASLGNTCFFVSFIIVFLYSVELFPTGVRNSVLGFLSVLARIGQIIAPPVNALDPTLTAAIFGISAILGAALCYPLPETKDVALPSTLEDSTTLPRKSLRLSRPINREQGNA